MGELANIPVMTLRRSEVRGHSLFMSLKQILTEVEFKITNIHTHKNN